jgi:hypothetical protein
MRSWQIINLSLAGRSLFDKFKVARDKTHLMSPVSTQEKDPYLAINNFLHLPLKSIVNIVTIDYFDRHARADIHVYFLYKKGTMFNILSKQLVFQDYLFSIGVDRTMKIRTLFLAWMALSVLGGASVPAFAVERLRTSAYWDEIQPKSFEYPEQVITRKKDIIFTELLEPMEDRLYDNPIRTRDLPSPFNTSIQGQSSYFETTGNQPELEFR